MSDLVYREDAIDAVISICDSCDSCYCGDCRVNYPGEKDARKVLEDLPSAQTLYGYKIEYLAYIARVMEKEGVTADYVVRKFDDMMGRAIKMVIDEMQQKVEEAPNE